MGKKERGKEGVFDCRDRIEGVVSKKKSICGGVSKKFRIRKKNRAVYVLIPRYKKYWVDANVTML